jgi:hypothetical protein
MLPIMHVQSCASAGRDQSSVTLLLEQEHDMHDSEDKDYFGIQCNWPATHRCRTIIVGIEKAAGRSLSL